MSSEVMTRNETRIEGAAIQRAGAFLIRYGLVLVLGWIGFMKFTAYEAAGIQPLITSSPLMAWMYKVMSVQTASNVIGVVEVASALLIGIRPLSGRASAFGGALAVMTFVTTITFLFTLPGWEPSLGGFPALSGSGGFLLKDVILLGSALWCLGDSLRAGGSKR